MPVVNRNTPVENISVPVPTPVQTQPKQQSPAPVQQIQAPEVKRPRRHLPLSFGGENDEFGRRVQGVSAVILPWSPQQQRMSRKDKPKRYAEGEKHLDEEEAFHQALDKNPDDHHTRMVFADWLQDRNDPRAEGYRVMGQFGLYPTSYNQEGQTPNSPQEISYWRWHPQSGDGYSPPHHLGSPLYHRSLMQNYPNRREAENALAERIANLPEDHKRTMYWWHNLIYGTTKLSRKKMVVRYTRPNLTPTQKERAKKVELVVLPKSIEGKKCGTCQYAKKHGESGLYCTNNSVHMNVKSNWGCKLWDAKGVKKLSRKRVSFIKAH